MSGEKFLRGRIPQNEGSGKIIQQMAVDIIRANINYLD
jgi:hypothetical protein